MMSGALPIMRPPLRCKDWMGWGTHSSLKEREREKKRSKLEKTGKKGISGRKNFFLEKPEKTEKNEKKPGQKKLKLKLK